MRTSKLLTREQVREVDRLAIERLSIPSIVLMENAGRNAAEYLDAWAQKRNGKRFVLFCGSGNNGGDGFVVGRHLHNRGWLVSFHLAGDPSRLSSDCEVNYRIIQAMGYDIQTISDTGSAEMAVRSVRPGDVVVDGLLGTGFTGALRWPLDRLIALLNPAPKAAMVALDVPSGLDCNTGLADEATIRADLTITFVAGKIGFAVPAAACYVGDCVVADIGCPPSLIDEVLASSIGGRNG